MKNDRIAELKAKLARRTELLRTLRNHVPGKDLWRWYVEVDRELFPFHVKDGKVWHGEKKPAKLPEPGETVWVKAPVTGRLASLGGVLLVGQSNTLHVENHAETWLRDDEVRKP